MNQNTRGSYWSWWRKQDKWINKANLCIWSLILESCNQQSQFSIWVWTCSIEILKVRSSNWEEHQQKNWLLELMCFINLILWTLRSSLMSLSSIDLDDWELLFLFYFLFDWNSMWKYSSVRCKMFYSNFSSLIWFDDSYSLS